MSSVSSIDAMALVVALSALLVLRRGARTDKLARRSAIVISLLVVSEVALNLAKANVVTPSAGTAALHVAV